MTTNPAGYSGTPLWKKLGLNDGQCVAFVRAPASCEATLGPLPAQIEMAPRGTRALDLAILFVRKAAELEADFARLAARLSPAGMLWIAWPKKASGVATDLSEDAVRSIGLAVGLVDVKVCAIDATWSGL